MSAGTAHAAPKYPWLGQQPGAQSSTIASRFAPPQGYKRVRLRPGSFADWLRHLPLKPDGTRVRLHNGRLKFNQFAHAAVVNIDTGKRDLQQCADAVIRLRAEYLYSHRRFRELRFHFTSGDLTTFERWAAGWRPRIRGNRVSWVKRQPTGTGRASFRRWLRLVYTYAGTISVRREMKPIPLAELQVGDIFVQAGSPGHAVLVVDMVRHARTGARQYLLMQSYTPAQDMHVLRNPKGGVWYSFPPGQRIVTPEWKFAPGDARRFR